MYRYARLEFRHTYEARALRESMCTIVNVRFNENKFGFYTYSLVLNIDLFSRTFKRLLQLYSD